MKTKEFIEKVEAMGYLTEIINNLTFVFDSNNSTVLSISNDRQYGIDCDYNAPATPELFLIAVEHAKTPVEERKSAKKYSVKVLPSSEGYLNVRYSYGDVVTNRYIISDTKEMAYYKTKFTEDEIEELKKQPDLAIDWDRVTLEEAGWE